MRNPLQFCLLGRGLEAKFFHRLRDGIRILSPTANSPCGFPEALFQEGLRWNLHVIAVDAGSSDQEPYFPGTDVCFDGKLRETGYRGIPVIIGSAGGGSWAHFNRVAEIFREIAPN